MLAFLALTGFCGSFSAFVGLVAADEALQNEQGYAVTARRWRREVSVERYETVSASGWCGEIPPEARVRGRSERLRRTEVVDEGRVREHYSDWCTYDAEGWIEQRRVVLDGVDTPPAWPEPPSDETCQDLGCERVLVRSERYVVEVRSLDGARVACPIPLERWDEFPAGAPALAQQGGVFGGTRCEALLPATPEAPL